MNKRPLWLPDIISCDGVWEDTLKRLYRIFEIDIKNRRLYLNGRPLAWDRRILAGETYEEGFWHLISVKDEDSGDRLPDFRRAERLNWCAPTIDNFNSPELKFWHYKGKGGRIETYLWIENHDYVVIFHRKDKAWGRLYVLVTAYYVDGPSRRRNLQRKYECRCSENKQSPLLVKGTAKDLFPRVVDESDTSIPQSDIPSIRKL